MAELTSISVGAQVGSSEWLERARRARRLSSLSLAWLCFEGAATTTAGLLAGSVAPISNGLDDAVEGLASVIVICAFRDHGRYLPARSDERSSSWLLASSCWLPTSGSRPLGR